MPDVRESGVAEADADQSGQVPPPETGDIRDGEVREENDGLTIHVHNNSSRSISISELSARTVLAILDSVTVKGSTAKLQVGLAQQEIENALTALQPMNRAQRRRA